MVAVNSWLLHRRVADTLQMNNKRQNSLCEFKLRLAKFLMVSYKDAVRKHARPSSSHMKIKCGKIIKPLLLDDIRKHRIGHFTCC